MKRRRNQPVVKVSATCKEKW